MPVDLFPHMTEGVGVTAAAELAYKWDELVGTLSLVTGRRAGTSAVRFAAGSYLGAGEFWQSWTGTPRWTHGCAIRVTGLAPGEYATLAHWYRAQGLPGTVFRAYSSLRALRVYADGTLAVRVSGADIATSAVGAFPMGVWVVLDESFTLADGGLWYATGEERVDVDGATVLTASGLANSENPGDSDECDYCRWGNVDAGNGATVDVMDATWQRGRFGTGAPSFPPAPLGDVIVQTLLPDGPGDDPTADAQWTPHGAATNWEAVAEAGIDLDATYVDSDPAGSRTDHYAYPAPTYSGTLLSIPFVTHWIWSRWAGVKTGPGSCDNHWRYTDDLGTAITEDGGGSAPGFDATTYTAWLYTRDTTPTGGFATPGDPWTLARLARCYFGQRNASALAGTNVRVTRNQLDVVLKVQAAGAGQRARVWRLH